MRNAVSLPTTPGGTTVFRDTEISSISDMIKKWEEIEKSDGGTDTPDGQRLSRGKRVSELSLKFEEGGPLSRRGDTEGGTHTDIPRDRPSILERGHPSTFAFLKTNSPSRGAQTVCKLKKISKLSKPNLKSKNRDLDTESRGGRDWLSSANRRTGVSERSRQIGQ